MCAQCQCENLLISNNLGYFVEVFQIFCHFYCHVLSLRFAFSLMRVHAYYIHNTGKLLQRAAREKHVLHYDERARPFLMYRIESIYYEFTVTSVLSLLMTLSAGSDEIFQRLKSFCILYLTFLNKCHVKLFTNVMVFNILMRALNPRNAICSLANGTLNRLLRNIIII